MDLPPKLIHRTNVFAREGEDHTGKSNEGVAVEALPAGKDPETRKSGQPSPAGGAALSRSPAVRPFIAPAPVFADSMDSLPVLGAMKQFIDGERARIRSTVLRMGLTFAFILLATLAGGLALGRQQFRKLRDDLYGQRAQITKAVADLDNDRREMNKKLAGVDQVVGKAGDSVKAAEQKAQEIGGKVEELGSEVADMKDNLLNEVAQMKQDQIFSAKDTKDLLDALDLKFKDVEAQNAALREAVLNLEDEMENRQIPVISSGGVSFDISPSNSDWKVNWRLPIPPS